MFEEHEKVSFQSLKYLGTLHVYRMKADLIVEVRQTNHILPRYFQGAFRHGIDH